MIDTKYLHKYNQRMLNFKLPVCKDVLQGTVIYHDFTFPAIKHVMHNF